MRLIQSSGVLVVLSQAWIEELYHQVLDRNLLAEAGYWGSPEDHRLPLITTLTGTDGRINQLLQYLHRIMRRFYLTNGSRSLTT